MEKAETVLGRISAQADAASANVEEQSAEEAADQNDNIVDEDAPVAPGSEVTPVEEEFCSYYNSEKAQAGCIDLAGHKVCCAPDLEMKGLCMFQKDKCTKFDCANYKGQELCEDKEEKTHKHGMCEFSEDKMTEEEAQGYGFKEKEDYEIINAKAAKKEVLVKRCAARGIFLQQVFCPEN